MAQTNKLNWIIIFRMLFGNFNDRPPVSPREHLAWLGTLGYINSTTVRYFLREYFSLVALDTRSLQNLKGVITVSLEDLNRVLKAVNTQLRWSSSEPGSTYPSII